MTSTAKLYPAWMLAVVLGSLSLAAADDVNLPAPANKQIDFAGDVQPILTQHCAKCHSADKQESNFRVDTRKSLIEGGDFGEPGIVPGKSEESQLIRFVAGLDGDFMPPDGKGERLTPEQIGILRAWIDQGAAMPEDEAASEKLTTEHWSFQPVVRGEVPEINDPFVANPIDAFILAKLREHELAPSPPADKAQLIRRLYLDMLGLLPSPEEVRAFASDQSPDAYEKLVERVLASEHYGERWARHWLDVVRFAESNGFETNVERPNAFQYRDWVIRALNADMPYDKFVFHQLAGDSTGEDAATGFLVGGAYDTVKSPDVGLTAMQRQDELSDMVNTTGTSFLGLTVGCARCHTHKFDPILQKDFYALQAVFAGVRHGERAIRKATGEAQQRQLATVEAKLKTLQQELDAFAVQPAVNARQNEDRFPPIDARFVRFTISATNSLEPCLDELEIWTAGEKPENVSLASLGAKPTSGGDYLGNPIHKLEHINDGQYGNSRSWISNTLGAGWVQIELAMTHKIDRVVWGRDRTEVYSDRLATGYRIEVAVEEGKWQEVATSAKRMPLGGVGGAAAFRAAGLGDDDANRAFALTQQIAALEAERGQLQGTAMAYAGTFSQPPPTFRLYRGEPTSPREQVTPEALTVLHEGVGALSLPAGAPEQQRRIALAKWIASPDNPLTARVIANRLWHYHFGRGIVGTPSDFGAMGFKPTHPQLLDWLASELISSQWSLKHLHRLMLLSNTYRQSSTPREGALAKDRDAALLWRFPPRRIEAEAIRDNVLLVSGALDQRMYGPGFMLFVPNANYSRNWVAKDEFGPAEYRRMIYAIDLRMKHDAVFGAFDCPDGGQIAPQRSRSTTPIQALNLLNSQFIAQQSQLAAERLRKDAGDGDVAAQVSRLFELTLGRAPTDNENADAVALVKEHGLASLCRAMFNTNEFLFLP